MREELKISAVASTINDNNQSSFPHEAKIGTGNITIDYNYVDGAKDNRLLDDCYFAGSIEVFSDGFISCDIFDEKYAQIIIKDFLEISGDTEVPNDIFWQSKTIDKNRWKKVHSFIKEHGIVLQYSEDMQFEKDLEDGIAYQLPEDEERNKHSFTIELKRYN